MDVTPLAGVWIEIFVIRIRDHPHVVTPLAGVWIEIARKRRNRGTCNVTPLAGVWIEILCWSLVYLASSCHSPCGSVD